ncbi:SOS response-associated peptidase [Lacunimicrobium album]
MCGRYTLRATAEQLQEIFNFIRDADWTPRYNIAPSQMNPVIRLIDGKRHAKPLRWGLVPPWAKDVKVGFKMINARSEEIAKSYKAPLKKRRCLVLTDGWYEWRDKQPYHFRFPDNEPFVFAGVWERWTNPEDQSIVESYSIFTTSSVGAASGYHDRMPVIIPQNAYDPSVPKAAYPKNCNGRNEKNLAYFITFAICCKLSHFVANRRILSR